MNWVRFAVVAFFLVCGIAVALTAVLGTFRFKFALNRMQAASIVDTLAMIFILIAMTVAFGLSWTTLKIILVIAFMWTAGPVSSHLITRLQAITDPDLDKHMSIEDLDAPKKEESEE